MCIPHRAELPNLEVGIPIEDEEGEEAEEEDLDDEDEEYSDEEYSEEEEEEQRTQAEWEEDEEEYSDSEEYSSSAVAEEAPSEEHEQEQGEPGRRVRPRLDLADSPGQEVSLYITYADHDDFMLFGVQSMTVANIKTALYPVLGILPFRQRLTLFDAHGSLIVDNPIRELALSDWGIEGLVSIQVQGWSSYSSSASSSTTFTPSLGSRPPGHSQ
jgi:hypothetical protein